MRTKYLIAITLILFGAMLRVLPHPWNFAPLGALALYGGAMFGRRLRFIVPIAALFVSDCLIGFYNPGIMASVYGSFLVMVVIGAYIGKRVTAAKVVAGALTSSLLFFFVTNAAVWAFGIGYPHSATGLLQSYVNGLPFFRNTLLSDLFYSGALFGLTALATVLARRSAASRVNSPPL